MVRVSAWIRRQVDDIRGRLRPWLSRVRRGNPSSPQSGDGLVGIEDILVVARDWACGVVARLRGLFGKARHGRVAGRTSQDGVHPDVPGRVPFQVWRTVSVAAAIFLSVFGMQLVMDQVQPLGLNKASKAQSQRISARFSAPFYRSGAQDRIAVVLIDDASVKARGVGWPPQYTFYAAMIERIVEHRPSAVFIDVLVEDERPYDSSLANAREWMADVLEQSGVPVIFASSQPGRETLFSGLPHVGSAVVSWQGYGEAYPLEVGDAHAVQWLGPASADAPAVTPALALYDIACAPTPGLDGPPAGCHQSAGALDTAERDVPLVLQWGHRRPVLDANPPKESAIVACTREAGDVYSPWRFFFSEAVKGLQSGMDPDIWEGDRETCPYTLTFHEESLPAPGRSSPLAGRVVLVGGQLAGMNDSVVSPTHQRLPGVYMHAMALDNLMTWGDGYLRRSESIQRVVLLVSVALASLALALVLRHSRGLAQGCLLLLAGAVFALVPAWLLQAYWRQPPLDWLGALALFGLITFIAKAKIRRREQAPPGHGAARFDVVPDTALTTTGRKR